MSAPLPQTVIENIDTNQNQQQSPTSTTTSPPTSSPRTPPFRSSFLSWVPTDEKQLYDTEAIINAPLYKLGFEQYHCAGLNTMTLRASTKPFDGTAAKEEQTKIFHEKFERKSSWFGGFSSSSSSSSTGSSSNSSCNASSLSRDQPINVKLGGSPQSKSNTTSPKTENNQQQKIQIPVRLHHIVFVHGFAGGICNWLPNLKPLGELVNQQNQTRLQQAIEKAKNNNNNQEVTEITILHAFDLPGFARSKRDSNISFGGPENVLRYFSWSFEEWFKHNDIPSSETSSQRKCNVAKWFRMEDAENIEFVSSAESNKKHHVTWTGHSFGAFLGAHFSIRYPARIQNLFLTDPFGVQVFNEEKNGLSTSTINWKFRAAAKVLLNVFEAALTPALRGLGPWAPDFIETMRPDFLERWKDLVEDPKVIMDYIFHCNAQKANTGDHAMAKTIMPNSRAVAALPLQPVLPSQLDPSIKLSIVYGQNSWMDKKAGEEMFDARKESLKKNFSEEVAKASTGIHDHIPNAGHQVNSDQPEIYNEIAMKVFGLKKV